MSCYVWQGTHDLLSEHAHIKDGLTRIVVEMMKREWPQQWPSLMQELDQLCKLGVRLVTFFFLAIKGHLLKELLRKDYWGGGGEGEGFVFPAAHIWLPLSQFCKTLAAPFWVLCQSDSNTFNPIISISCYFSSLIQLF